VCTAPVDDYQQRKRHYSVDCKLSYHTMWSIVRTELTSTLDKNRRHGKEKVSGGIARRADVFTLPLHNTDPWTSRSGKSRVTHGFLLGIEAQEQR